MTVLLLWVLGTFPSSSRTAWMEPAAFHLKIGMPRAEAVSKLNAGGWRMKPGKTGDALQVEFDDGRTLTLVFDRGKLNSVRFELVGFVPDVRAAFDEKKKDLRRSFGPATEKGTTLIYDRANPQIMAVLSTDPKTSFGRQGLGFFVVRYFAPPPE